MTEPIKQLQRSKRDDFDQFDEAQPFLQLLADMLNRIVKKPNSQSHKQPEQKKTSTD